MNPSLLVKQITHQIRYIGEPVHVVLILVIEPQRHRSAHAAGEQNDEHVEGGELHPQRHLSFEDAEPFDCISTLTDA